MPAEPQQTSASCISLISIPGISFSTCRGCWRTPLGVPEVAGIMVRRRYRQRMPLGYRTQLLQKLRDILDLVGERLRPLGVLGVITQQVSVILHRRAAPGGVDHHVVKVLLLEGVYGFSGEAERLLLAPGMRAKSAAAALVLGRDDLAAFGGEDPNGRGVDL